MDAESVTQVGVIGAGTMGAGIAQVFLRAGCTVYLQDVSEPQLETARGRIAAGLERWQEKGQLDDGGAALGRLTTTPNLVALQGCDWIVEAVPEEQAAKEAVLGTMGRLCRPETVLSSNT